jgi:hypothetical protein
LFEHQAGERPPPPPAQLVEAGIRRHSVRPRGERRPAVEAVEAAGDGDERLLAGVEGVGLVTGEPAAQGIQAVVVGSQQTVESALVPTPRGLDELGVVVRGVAVDGPERTGAADWRGATT